MKDASEITGRELQSVCDQGELSAEDTRRRLYEISHEALIGAMAADDSDDVIMIAFHHLLTKINRQLVAIAAGSTFDRFNRLENGKAVAS